MDTKEMIQKFLENGGTIRRIPPGARAMSERQMYLAAHASDLKREEARINAELRERERREKEQRLILARALVAEADAIPVPPSQMTRAQRRLFDKAKKARKLLEEKAPRSAAKMSVYSGLDLSVVRSRFPLTRDWDDATLRERLAGAMTLGDAEFSLSRWR